jgi:hypothetical protein
LRRLHPIQSVGDCLHHHRISVVGGAICACCSYAGTIAVTRHVAYHRDHCTSTGESIHPGNDLSSTSVTSTHINPAAGNIYRIDQRGNRCSPNNGVHDCCHPEKEWRGTGQAFSLQTHKNRR